jgi:hypothetical protein
MSVWHLQVTAGLFHPLVVHKFCAPCFLIVGKWVCF